MKVRLFEKNIPSCPSVLIWRMKGVAFENWDRAICCDGTFFVVHGNISVIHRAVLSSCTRVSGGFNCCNNRLSCSLCFRYISFAVSFFFDIAVSNFRFRLKFGLSRNFGKFLDAFLRMDFFVCSVNVSEEDALAFVVCF